MALHPILKRQLKRLKILEHEAPGTESWEQLLERISAYYVEADQDRYTLERSLSISSEEMKALHRELMQALASAAAANLAKGDFLANMSHEIRTPINAVVGFLYLLRRTELSPKQLEYLDRTAMAANGLLDIVNDILDFSKIEANKVNLERIDFDLNEVLFTLSNFLRVRSFEKGLKLMFAVDFRVPQALIGDPIRLGQILLNLGGNAVKFTEKGEVKVSVTLESESTEEVTLLFSVRDTGIGMDPEQTSNLFNAFIQADLSTTRRFGGTGLGLAICKPLVALMGGELRAESRLGEGSCFSFTCRLARHPTPLATPKTPKPIAKLRILLVSEDENLRTVLRQQLELLRFQVEEVPSGKAAIQAVKDTQSTGSPFDLVFLDWLLKDQQAPDTARTIREACQQEAPRLLLVSVAHQREVQEDAERTPFEGLLFFPAGLSQIYDIIAIALADRRRWFHPATGRGKASSFHGEKVLLVEDNEVNGMMARVILESVGIEVAMAANGHEALRMIHARRYDAVLMDLHMPVMDGYQAARTIRANNRLRDLPIIAMTADAQIGVRDKVLEAGMNDYITKPIDPPLLFETLRHWIRIEDPAEPSVIENDRRKAATTAQQLPNSLQGLKIRDALERLDGNEFIYLRFLNKFAEFHGDVMVQIQKALDAGDTSTASRYAHSIKGASGNLGAEELGEAAHALEAALQVGAGQDIETAIRTMDKALALVLKTIAQILAGRPESPT